ncbi:hypothetical protein MY11210_008093 [Beauveria gryllotalpidicola]
MSRVAEYNSQISKDPKTVLTPDRYRQIDDPLSSSASHRHPRKLSDRTFDCYHDMLFAFDPNAPVPVLYSYCARVKTDHRSKHYSTVDVFSFDANFHHRLNVRQAL